MKKLFVLLIFLLVSANLMAQQAIETEVEMADKFRADGKIYVVVAVIVVVFAGIITYLINLDRKIGKLEKEIGGKK